ncbi:UDP-galactose transporter senju-like isoform X1 [Littorina saxatilis]|uniref:UDP-galactose transporter senju-like isoform X1 n=1 Tax=Littorina saxatilis TaxID=31220 RepID=UPI0038B53B3C
MGLISAEMFPTKLSFIIFISYMGLFINQGILVTTSKSKDNSYSYSTVTVVLLTECLKLVAAVILYMKDHTVSEFTAEFIKHRKVLMLYFIPAGLYCLYNNLQFTNLANYDPTTYFLLLQLRVVVTGVVFQFLFKKHLSRVQWASVFLLTLGCIIKEISHVTKATTAAAAAQAGSAEAAGAGAGEVSWLAFFNIHLVFILLQVFSSCFAGVYNEYLLKDAGCDVHIMMANVYMYVQSILCNLIALTCKGELFSAFTVAGLSALAQPSVLAIIANNAAIGIVTSLFLRTLNSILKTFASALELMFTAILCWMIFGIPVDLYTFLALLIVIAATFLYAQNPVVNKARNEVVAEAKQTDSKV